MVTGSNTLTLQDRQKGIFFLIKLLYLRDTDWKTFLLGTGKFNEDTDKATFDKLANKKITPGELVTRPEDKWDEWLEYANIKGDDREAIVYGLKQIILSGL